MTKHLLAGRQPLRRAQETAAHLLLSGVLVYGEHEPANKAKFLQGRQWPRVRQ